jgi:hypothetical protein
MEIATIREAVAVFDEPARLEDAMSDLQSNGIDRAYLSVLAPASTTDLPGGSSGRLGNDPDAPRQVVVSDTDLRQGRVLGTGLAATIAGFAAAGVTVATGGVAAATIAAATAAGGVGLAGTIIGRQLAEQHGSFLDAQLAAGGAVLWVRVRDADAEKIVLEVLRRYSTNVRIHDLPIEGAASRPIGGSFQADRLPTCGNSPDRTQ